MLRLFRPKSRAGKLRLSAIITAIASVFGVMISQETIFPSLGDNSVCNHDYRSSTNECSTRNHVK